MRLRSFGLIFKKKHFPKWNKTHAWVPTPVILKKNICRVFYAGRDEKNLSKIGSFDINLSRPKKILNVSSSPVLSLGKIGYFDDCAVIPSQIFYFNKNYYLFYVGWTQGKTVADIASIGLAYTKNLNKKFKRTSEVPLIGKSRYDPIFTASCFCVKENNKLKLYYSSNTRWKVINKVPTPKYLIKEASSKNLFNWQFKNKKTFRHKDKEIALTRPWIFKHENKEMMLYSYGKMKNKKNNYRIGLAVKNKSVWKRMDKKLKIYNSVDNFDNKTKEYASAINYAGKTYVFYNGNNYGEKGIGLAIID